MLSNAWAAQAPLVKNEMEHSEVRVLIRARNCGVFTVAFFALVISTAVPAHADVVPSPEATEEVVDQPAPSDPPPSPEPSAPEESSEPAPTEPVETTAPLVPPGAPVGTATFDPSRPPGTVVETFRSGNGTTTSGGTGAEVPRSNAPAPRVVEPAEKPTESATASPTSATPTASPTPVTAREGSAGSGVTVRATSEQTVSAPTLPSLIIGLVVLVGGLVIVRYRGSLWKAAGRAVPGGSSERVDGLQGPFRVGVVGAIVALIGVVMNGYAGWQLWGSLVS